MPFRTKPLYDLKGRCFHIFQYSGRITGFKKQSYSLRDYSRITAALGAAAFAGMPLTARGYSTSVRFLTYYTSEIVSEEYWKELAATTDTLVFYMSKGTLNGLVERLKTLGISADKKIAVIEQATTPFQKVYTSSFEEFNEKFEPKTLLPLH